MADDNLAIEEWDIKTANSKSRAAVLDELLPNVTYSIRIQASNQQGAGVISGLYNVKTDFDG